MQNAANYDFTPEETIRMHDYLLKGGFLWIDDNWDPDFEYYISSESREILPEATIVDLPVDHPIFSTFYQLDVLPQIRRLVVAPAVVRRGNSGPRRSTTYGCVDGAREDGRARQRELRRVRTAGARRRPTRTTFTPMAAKGYALGVDRGRLCHDALSLALNSRARACCPVAPRRAAFRRTLAVSFLSFASGLPLGLVWYAIPDWMRDDRRGHPPRRPVDAGAGALVRSRCFWSPLMDRYVPPFWGRRRGWMAVTQLLLAVLVLMLAGVGERPERCSGLSGAGLSRSRFASASQDIAIDAYAVEVLRRKSRERRSARVSPSTGPAMLVSGGVSITLAARIGWPAVNGCWPSCSC
jgi:hypothetical protein